MQEKRRHQRIEIQIPVTCEAPGGAVFQGVTVDLSIGGLYIEAPQSPGIGVGVTVSGEFPGLPGAKLPAVVRWTKPGGFGLQFGLLGARETHALSALMHKGRP